MQVPRRAVLIGVAVVALVVGTLYLWRAFVGQDALAEPALEASLRAGADIWQPPQPRAKAVKVSSETRDELLKRAQIWRPPSVPIERVDFTADAPAAREVRCRFVVTELDGTTPKFDCALPDGEVVRIKYGRTGEVPAEIASTRLLRALGFAADRVNYIESLRCYGCPEEPFSVMKAVEITQAEKIYKSLLLGYDSFESFQWVALERKFDGRSVEAEQVSGWAMFELDEVNAASGGAPRVHVDALRLLAVFLAHWDNKPDNQRLACVSPNDWDGKRPCTEPFLLLQDLGSTFGPAKVNLDNWRVAPLWQDRARCLTSMRELPFDGATFGEVQISDEGRRFLAGLLTRLTDRQLTDLFTTSRFDDGLGVFRRSSAVLDWVRVFKERVQQVADGPPCPTVPE